MKYRKNLLISARYAEKALQNYEIQEKFVNLVPLSRKIISKFWMRLTIFHQFHNSIKKSYLRPSCPFAPHGKPSNLDQAGFLKKIKILSHRFSFENQIICRKHSSKLIRKIRQQFVGKICRKNSSEKFVGKIRRKNSSVKFFKKILYKNFVEKICHSSEKFVGKIRRKNSLEKFVGKIHR